VSQRVDGSNLRPCVIALLALGALGGACSSSSNPANGDGGPSPDSGEAGEDAAVDASISEDGPALDALDATEEGPRDASVEAPSEASTKDAPHDAAAVDSSDASPEPCACATGEVCVGGVCQAASGVPCSCAGWQVCRVTGQCVAPPEQSQFRVGACYHDTDAWKPGSTPGSWDSSSAHVFIPLYDQPGVRQTVRQQLQAMANSGAGVVKTILWYGDTATAPTWPNVMVAFPPTARQLQNLHDYVVDVSTTLRPDGTPMDLVLSTDWVGVAGANIGDVSKGVLGPSCMTTSAYGQAVTQTYTSVLDAVKNVYRADGLPAVSLMYLRSEVMVCATDDESDPSCSVWGAGQPQPDVCHVSPSSEAPMRNQQWFLSQFYPGFVSAARAAGIIPSVYFGGGDSEVDYLDDAWVDPFSGAQPDFTVVNGRRSLFNVFRSAWWMKQHALPVPPRFDFDFGAHPTMTTASTMDTRVLDNLEAGLAVLYPGQPIRYGIVETGHNVDPTVRAEEGKALAAERLVRGSNPEVVLFWSTPGDVVEDNVAPSQFDFSSFTTDGIVFPFANLVRGFETSSNGTLPDDWTTLVPSSAPANAFWNTTNPLVGKADLRFDASRCASGCASVESAPVAVSAGQFVALHMWQENAQPSPALQGTADGGAGGMTFAFVPTSGGVDGAPLLQWSAVGHATTTSAPYSQASARYGAVLPIPTGVTAVRLRVGMNGVSPTTTMDLDEVQ
jgi:hypothetical protein